MTRRIVSSIFIILFLCNAVCFAGCRGEAGDAGIRGSDTAALPEVPDESGSCETAEQSSGCGTSETETENDSGTYISFGAYEQDNNPENGKEDLIWLVLAEEEDRILVISRYAVDVKPYHTEYTDVTWDTCTLRTWLNREFYENAFDSPERKRIMDTDVTATYNPFYDTPPGKTTRDKIFLLSVNEANMYMPSDEAKICVPTPYAISRGVYVKDTRDGFTCFWWLRTPGISQRGAADITDRGAVNLGGYMVSDSLDGVRPAMWISREYS